MELKEDGKTAEFIIEGEVYKGIFNVQWDEYGKKNVMTFTALSDKGIAIWEAVYGLSNKKLDL